MNFNFFEPPESDVTVDEERKNPLRIRVWPDPVLFKRCEEVRDPQSVAQLVADMLDLIDELGLYGLSAPQVGYPLKLFVVDPVKCGVDESNPRVFINPECSTLDSTLERAREGCVSVPMIAPIVERPRIVRVTANDLVDERRFWRDVAGAYGRCIQHEMDHLDGVMTTKRATRGEMLIVKKFLKGLC